MNNREWELKPEQLVSFISRPPKSKLSDLVTVFPLAKPKSLQRRRRSSSLSSSLGSLDKLPLELLQQTFARLDIRSLARVSCVSVRGKHFVESLSTYQDLLKHVPEALAALGQTGLASAHTPADLLAALQSENCVACGLRGDFLFLPTCERCCLPCLATERSLWVLQAPTACHCFRLTRSELEQLPILHSVEGSVRTLGAFNPRRYHLVSVKAAKELALSIHGSLANIADSPPRRDPVTALKESLADPDPESSLDVRVLQESYMWQLDFRQNPRDPRSIRGVANIYHSTAEIEFPILLPDGKLDTDARSCRGCRKAITDKLSESSMGRLPPSFCFLLLLKYFRDKPARSRDPAKSNAELVKHISHCDGAQKLISELYA